MSTSELFLARPLAGRHWNSTLNGRVEFGDTARAEERLGRYILAGFAESNVTEICTLMKTTSEFFVALGHAEMTTIRVRSVCLNRTANVLALMLLALFQLVANSLALQVVDLIHLFTCHHLRAQQVRVINLVARVLELCLVADAAFVDELLAEHALVIVTLLDALVAATGQELLTQRVAHWDRLNASLTLPPQQALNGIMTTAAIELSRGVLLAGQAFTLMTDLFTKMMLAVKFTTTLFLAGESRLSTE